MATPYKLKPAEVEELISFNVVNNNKLFTTIEKFIGNHSEKDKNGKWVLVPARYKCNDIAHLEKGQFYNKEAMDVKVGSVIFNKVILEKSGIIKELGFRNDVMRGKTFGKLQAEIVEELLINKGYPKTIFDNFINNAVWLGGRCHTMLMCSYTPKTAGPLPEVIRARDKFVKENKEKFDAGDIVTTVKLENELLKIAQDAIKDDPGYMMFDSQARGSFDNNYKQSNIMRGAILDPVTGKQKIVVHGFMEGYSKDELPAAGNSVVLGAYPKGVGTAVGGYMTKKLYAALQSVVISDEEDCGTKATGKVLLTSEKIPLYKYTNIVVNGKIVELTSKNINDYVGKEINVRLPGFCAGGTQVCKTCAGAKTARDAIGIKTLGLTAAKMTGNLLNASMKKFHVATVKLYKLDPNKIFL